MRFGSRSVVLHARDLRLTCVGCAPVAGTRVLGRDMMFIDSLTSVDLSGNALTVSSVPVVRCVVMP